MARLSAKWVLLTVGLTLSGCGNSNSPNTGQVQTEDSRPSVATTEATVTASTPAASEASDSNGSGLAANTAADPRLNPAARASGPPAQIAIASSDLAVGHQRFAFAILDRRGSLLQNAKATVKFSRLTGPKGEVVEPASDVLPVAFYPSQLEPAGLYVTYFNFDVSGLWGAEISASLADSQSGDPPTTQRVRFTVASKAKAIGVGEKPPPTANRTITTEPVLAKLTSDPIPDPDFYRLTVDQAIATGKPTVVVFSTPGHCQSKICGPTLDEVKLEKAQWASRGINFIHIEVYKDFSNLTLADEMVQWGLETEPWVFVLGGDGTVVERLEGSVTVAELEPILRQVAGG